MSNLLRKTREQKGVKTAYEMSLKCDSEVRPQQITQFENASKPSVIAIRLYKKVLDLTPEEVNNLVGEDE